jgi:hypothetical protein
MTNAYAVTDPDYALSPRTGMARQHYVDRAGLPPRRFDRYPDRLPGRAGQDLPAARRSAWRWRSAEFEALERTLTLAGPLMHVDPDVAINGIKLRDYYCAQLYRALTPGHPNSLPLPEDLPDATYQFTCEFGGLFKTLLLLPDVVWPYFTQQQKDEMAVTISKWAHHRTTQNNWRIFNIMALSFLKKHGYAIDDELLKSHLLWVVSYHSGSGWYLEQTYNYYTISLFVVYGTIWNRTFGDEHYPEIAAAIENSAHELMKPMPTSSPATGSSTCGRGASATAPGSRAASRLVHAKGRVRPSIPAGPGGCAPARCSSSSPAKISTKTTSPAWGFMATASSLLQNYSCPASPFLMFLPFLCLALPDDSPFWTARRTTASGRQLGAGRR